jgi:hypothetical protein
MARQKEYTRKVRAVYYENMKATKVVKETRGTRPEGMVQAAFRHLRYNHYAAMVVEVFDDDGKLYDILKRHINGKVESMLQQSKIKD